MYSLFSNDFSASVSGSACNVQSIGFYATLLDLVISPIGRWYVYTLRQKVGARKDSPRWFPRYLEYMIVSNSSALFYESVLYVPQGIDSKGDSKGDGIVHNTNGVV
jgi:hypothetical protein